MLRQLVDQADRGPPHDDRVNVHFAEGHTAIFDHARRNGLKVADLVRRLAASVGLNQPDHHIDALRFETVAFPEHRIGLARPGRRAQINLEPSSRLPADQAQELLGSRPMRFC